MESLTCLEALEEAPASMQILVDEASRQTGSLAIISASEGRSNDRESHFRVLTPSNHCKVFQIIIATVKPCGEVL